MIWSLSYIVIRKHNNELYGLCQVFFHIKDAKRWTFMIKRFKINIQYELNINYICTLLITNISVVNKRLEFTKTTQGNLRLKHNV